MSKLLHRIRLWFSPKNPLSRRIAQVCALSLKEVGLSVGGNVFELRNSKNRAGWLVSLQVPEHFHVGAVDALALRLFLSRRVEAALGMAPRSLQLVLNFNAEAKRLPFAESGIDASRLRSRQAALTAGAHKTAQPATPFPPLTKGQSAARQPGQAGAEQATSGPAPAGSKPVSASARVQEKKVEALLASLTDEDMYEVKETSMTDFDRALS